MRNSEFHRELKDTDNLFGWEDHMTPDQEERIRTRAHELWEAHGKPAGLDDEFWFRAESEIKGQDGEDAVKTVSPPLAAD